MTSLTACLGDIEHTYDSIDSLTKPESVDTGLLTGPAFSWIKPEPFGVCLVLGAWNYPLPTSLPMVATALAAGNCVCLKPSELSPNTSNVMAKLFKNYLDNSALICLEGAIEIA